VNSILDHLDQLNPVGGLYPMIFNITSGQASPHYGFTITTGSSADSFYEYLLKFWLQTNKQNKRIRQIYDEAVEGIITYLLRNSTPSHDLYVVKYFQGNPVDEMDHLSCFLPGMLALGAHGKNYDRDLKIAEDLLATCINLYMCHWTGLAPESVNFVPGKDFVVADARYLLRPETIESLFILHRITKKNMYRDVAWKIFLSLNKYCRTSTGFSGLEDISREDSPKYDIMQAFFLSQTLKYLYLLFGSDDRFPFSEYVFNTEAHPLRILKK